MRGFIWLVEYKGPSDVDYKPFGLNFYVSSSQARIAKRLIESEQIKNKVTFNEKKKYRVARYDFTHET